MKEQSPRQRKVGELIRREVADLFLKDTKGLFSGTFITVTEVEMSPDLSVARIYLSIFDRPKAEAVLAMIEEANSQIRRQIGMRVGKQLRIVPNLRFFEDTTLASAAKMDKLLNSIVIPPVNENEDSDS